MDMVDEPGTEIEKTNSAPDFPIVGIGASAGAWLP